MQLQTLDHEPATRQQPMPVPPHVPRPLPPRHRRRRRRRRDPLSTGTIALCSGALLLVVLALPVVLLLVRIANAADAMIGGVPKMPDKLEQAPQRSVVVDRTGKRLATLQVENRVLVELDKIPDHVVDAVLATEDQSYWRHAGVNWGAVMRSALRLASSGEVEGGGSTVTQQVVKNRFAGTEQSLTRKISEAAMAAQLERQIGKHKILETYLNDSYFGNGVYGVATAAEYYWSKSVDELTPAEGALLAGIIRAPEKNNPVDSPERALARRDIVLEQMVETGALTREQADKAASRPLDLKIKRTKSRGSPFLIDIIRRELESDPKLGKTPEERWDTALRGGLKIRTTLHAGLQRAAEKTIREVLEHKKKDPLASIVAVDPASGDVLAAAVGPKDYGEGKGKTTINPAMPGLGGMGRPPGSTFKAFQLVAALENDVSPTHIFTSGPTYQSQYPGCPNYEVTNYGGADLGTLDMATATAKSSNTYFIHLMDISGGPEAMVDVAHRMGIESEIEPHCASVLGSENVFPVEMASAFATLANHGKRCEPHTIELIRDDRGRVVRKADGDCKRAMEKDTAHAATAMLQGPIQNGTASQYGNIGRPAAGKTGTTTDNKDAWFVGYVPQLSAATWVGHEIPKTLVHPLCGEVTGGCLPTILWQRFMTRATEILELPVEAFPEPPPPPLREVPSVLGMDEQTATQTLIDQRFVPQVEVIPDAAPAGTVVRQSPGPGEAVPEATPVVISVSNGQPVVEELPEPPPPPEDFPTEFPTEAPTLPPIPGPGEEPTIGPIPGPGPGFPDPRPDGDDIDD
jgi:membrane peptidoglycan carboxypeptidase